MGARHSHAMLVLRYIMNMIGQIDLSLLESESEVCLTTLLSVQDPLYMSRKNSTAILKETT